MRALVSEGFPSAQVTEKRHLSGNYTEPTSENVTRVAAYTEPTSIDRLILAVYFQRLGEEKEADIFNGGDKSQVKPVRLYAQHVPRADAGHDYMYIYSDIISPTRFGSQKVNILDVIPLPGDVNNSPTIQWRRAAVILPVQSHVFGRVGKRVVGMESEGGGKLSPSEVDEFLEFGIDSHATDGDLGYWLDLDTHEVSEDLARRTDEFPLCLTHLDYYTRRPFPLQ
ncbi:hypothetical protein E2C01_026905 [Portunus trituberculatus]|uniref:Uncharacterized protein n=1 Tax=Portunus trituberculatus TaxID=210409 RepID=A0A5B7EGJ1_PORTR|nr:hypothetical protein [Portunus trituberculatus]